jgi:hypothetical protein
MPRRATIALVLCLALIPAAHAKGPKWKEGQGQPSNGHSSSTNVSVNISIGNHHRAVITNYYATGYSRGHCPPGLAKKNNGCLPPGHAKRFVVGQPLAHHVTYSALPSDLSVRLVAPAGYTYIYLDGHVLLMALSTRLVVDSFAISVNIR